MWSNEIETFQKYMGTGLIIGWFLITVVYLLMTEKRKNIRILFVYVPILILAVFFFPPFSSLMEKMAGTDTYFRMLWLLPVTMVIAYGVVHIYNRLKGKIRIFWAGAAAVLVMISGSFIYSSPLFSRAENAYHVPQAVVDICDAIEVEGREVMAVFPLELIPYVRQYSPVVCMPYGREVLTQIWGNWNELLGVMQSETIDAARLAELAKQKICHYIILPEEKEVQGSLLDYDYILFDNIDGYVIYQDTTIYIGL